MADLTENIGFTLIDPKTDGDEAVNLFTQLGWNWVLVDAAIGNLDTPALELGLTSTDIAGILLERAHRVKALEEGGN